MSCLEDDAGRVRERPGSLWQEEEHLLEERFKEKLAHDINNARGHMVLLEYSIV